MKLFRFDNCLFLNGWVEGGGGWKERSNLVRRRGDEVKGFSPSGRRAHCGIDRKRRSKSPYGIGGCRVALSSISRNACDRLV